MNHNERRRVLLVDDHPMTRKGLAEALSAEADLQVCGEAEGWREALVAIRANEPDLVVLDLNLKDGSGWDLLRHLGTEGGAPPVLVFSVCDEEVYATRLLKSGARGYLMKDEPIEKILGAVRKVLAGHIAVSDAVASNLIYAASSGAAPAASSAGVGALSDRELQVLELLRQGLGNKEIAGRLALSHKTVGTYKARLMEKLGVRTTPELIDALGKTEGTCPC